MGEMFRRKLAKAFKHRECAAYTARLATADLLSGAKGTIEVVDVTCDLAESAAAPPLWTEVIVRTRTVKTADVIACNRRIATIDLESAGLERIFGRDGGMAIGVVTTIGEITPTMTVSIPQPPEGP